MQIAKASIKWKKQLEEYLIILETLLVELAITYKIIIIEKKLIVVYFIILYLKSYFDFRFL